MLVVMGILTIGAVGCGDGRTEPDFNPDFMVGDWLAESLVQTSVADPQVFTDLVANLGVVFTLSVQPSGRYTGILTGFGQSTSESGRFTIDDAFVILMPEVTPGPAWSALWERVGDSVILEGESEFDFNLDGTPEAATLRQVLIPN